MNTGKMCSKPFRGLYNIRQIREHLSVESTKCLIHAFVTSLLDYLQLSFAYVRASAISISLTSKSS